jgi:hypothetical protein
MVCFASGVLLCKVAREAFCVDKRTVKRERRDTKNNGILSISTSFNLVKWGDFVEVKLPESQFFNSERVRMLSMHRISFRISVFP